VFYFRIWNYTFWHTSKIRMSKYKIYKCLDLLFIPNWHWVLGGQKRHQKFRTREVKIKTCYITIINVRPTGPGAVEIICEEYNMCRGLRYYIIIGCTTWYLSLDRRLRVGTHNNLLYNVLKTENGQIFI